MSDGTPKPATCPRCLGPLAYGHATATKMRCDRRFGKAFLRGGLGRRHLTERRLRERPGGYEPPEPRAGEADRREHDADHAERDQQGSTRAAGPRRHHARPPPLRRETFTNGRHGNWRVPQLASARK